ncbi:hypothetical protein BHM03_00027585 [Ensete ventricosum]|nr:hypothetical protein BHM03_00027585 [Ensete ventricosum]
MWVRELSTAINNWSGHVQAVRLHRQIRRGSRVYIAGSGPGRDNSIGRPWISIGGTESSQDEVNRVEAPPPVSQVAPQNSLKQPDCPSDRVLYLRTVQVGNISDLAGEREIREFFSFSGDIEHLEIRGLLSSCSVFCSIFSDIMFVDLAATLDKDSPSSGRVYVSKAHDVVSSMLAKGSSLRQDAINKAKAFDEKHQLRANASAKVVSFDKRVGLSEKITVGISIVNEKVKSVDQKLHVSDKTMAALFAAERKLNDTGTAVKSNRYVTAGTAWLNGAFGKVAKAGHVAGTRTREKFQLAVSNLTEKSIPRKFVLQFRDLSEDAKLKGPSGNLWSVRLKRSGDDVIFTGGWSKFAEDHRSELGDFLVFRYIGDSCFKVVIFEKNACEKEH